MKRKIFCTMIIILIGNIATAQEDHISLTDKNSGYWNLGFSMGLSGGIHSKNFTEKPGLNFNVDVSLTPQKNTGFFLNYSTSKLSAIRNDYFAARGEGQFVDVTYLQFTMGPRIYSNSKNSFIDGGLGYFRIDNHKVAGLTLGLGGRIKVSDVYAVAITGRLNAANIFNNAYTYFSLSAGVEINDKKGNFSGKKPENKFSVGVLAGTLGDGFGGTGNKCFNAEITYGIGKQTALILNYVYSYSKYGYTNYSGNYIDLSKGAQSEITGGVRLYMKGNSLRVFTELLTGAYIITSEAENYPSYYALPFSYSNSYFGFTFGGGVEFRIIDNLSGLVKTDVSNYIKEGSYLGLFGGLKYQL